MKIFRRIRKQFFIDNKFFKYILYACGEILLIITGILIALNVSNANERRNVNKKFRSAIKEVHSDLRENIEYCDRIMPFFEYKDSLIYEVKHKEVTRADYLGKYSSRLANLITNYQQLGIKKNGFDKLLSIDEDVRQPIDSIFMNLSVIYNKNKSNIELGEEITRSFIENHMDWLRKNTSWTGDLYFNNRVLSDDEINFYLTNDYYQNAVNSYHIFLLMNYYRSISSFRYNSYKSYQEITNFLNLADEVEKKTPKFYYDARLYEQLIGSYKDSTNTYQVIAEENGLELLCNDQKIILQPFNKYKFIGTPGTFFIEFKYNDNDEVVGLIDRFGDYSIELQKKQLTYSDFF